MRVSELPEASLDEPRRDRHWLWPTRARVLLLLAITMAIWGWLDVRLRGGFDTKEAVHKTDFTVYTEAGAAFFDGRDPYSVTNPRGWGYLYPPLFAICVAPLAALSHPMQVLCWFGISVMLCWGCIRETALAASSIFPRRQLNSVIGPLPDWLGYLAIATVALPALNCLQRGQVSVLKIYLLMLGFRVWMQYGAGLGRFVAGNLLALPIVLKIVPALPVGVLIGEHVLAAWRSTSGHSPKRGAASGIAGLIVGLALVFFLIPSAVVGWQANWQHLNRWYNWVAQAGDRKIDDRFEGDSTSVRNQSLVNAARHLGNWSHYRFFGGPDDEGPEQYRKGGRGLLMDAPSADQLLLVLRFAACALLSIAAWRAGRSGEPLPLAAVFGLACVATLILSPIARVHYFVMLWPAVLFVPAWLLDLGRWRQAVAFAVAPAALVIVYYASIKSTGRVGMLGLGVTLWYTLACITLARHCRPRPQLHVVYPVAEQREMPKLRQARAA